MAEKPTIQAFFDEPTNTVSYLVADPATKKAAVVDPVLDYDHNAGTVDTRSVEVILKAADEAGYGVKWVLETHAHADHLSGAPLIKAKTGAKIGIGEHIKDVQRIFRPIFNATDLVTDGSDFDHLFQDGERFKIGNLEAEVLYTPGHTPADVSYKIEDAVFVGDTLFMPDYGTARADFPGGDAHQLYRSIKRLQALPPETRLFMSQMGQSCRFRPIAGSPLASGSDPTADIDRSPLASKRQSDIGRTRKLAQTIMCTRRVTLLDDDILSSTSPRARKPL